MNTVFGDPVIEPEGGKTAFGDPVIGGGPIQKMKPTGNDISPWQPTIGQRLEMAAPNLFGSQIQPATGMPEGFLPRMANAAQSLMSHAPFAQQTELDPTQPNLVPGQPPQGFNAFVNPFLQQVNLQNVLLAKLLPSLFAAKEVNPVVNATKAVVSALFGSQGAEQAGQAFGRASVQGLPDLGLSPGGPEATVVGPLLNKLGLPGVEAPTGQGTTEQWENLANEILGVAQMAGATVGPHALSEGPQAPKFNFEPTRDIYHGSREMPFQMPNRPAIPMGDKPQFYETPPLIGERPLRVEQPIVSQFGVNPQDPLQIEKGVGFAGEPKQGGQISFQGQGIPSAMQSRVIPKGESSEQAALMQGGFVPSSEQGRAQSGINTEDLVPAIKLGGRLLIGQRGDAHKDILERNGLPEDAVGYKDAGRGFVNKNQPDKFLSRTEAGPGTAWDGGLDSQDLPGASQHRAMREAGFSDSEIRETLGVKMQSGLGLPEGKEGKEKEFTPGYYIHDNETGKVIGPFGSREGALTRMDMSSIGGDRKNFPERFEPRGRFSSADEARESFDPNKIVHPDDLPEFKIKYPEMLDEHVERKLYTKEDIGIRSQKLQSGLNFSELLPGGKDDPMFPILTRIQDAGFETLYSEHGMGEGDTTPYVVFKRTSPENDARIQAAAKAVGAEVEERPKRIGVYLKESDKVQDIKKDWETFTKHLGQEKLQSGLNMEELKKLDPAHIAELIARGKIEPVDNLNQGEVFDRVRNIQKDFASNPTQFSKVLGLQIKLKRNTISDPEMLELFSKENQPYRVSASYLADLSDQKSVENLGKVEWRKVEGDRLQSGETSKLYSGLPVFDENLWGSKEEAERMRGLFAKRLNKDDPQAAEKLKQAAPVESTDARTKAILGNANANPIHRREQVVAQPGQRLNLGDKFTNFKNRVINIANEGDKILNPWDVIFDYLDGGKAQFKGPLMENIRKPLDDAWNDHANSYHYYTDPIRDLAKKHKMGEQASARIGVYLTAQQEGGVRKMVESGIGQKTISDILSSMKPEELEVAKAMRKAYDEVAPQVQRVAKATGDGEVKIPNNYSPWAREWRKYKPEPDELGKPALEKGASIDDVLWPKLKVDQKVKTDAFSIFDRWIKDATHYVASRQLLKDSAKIVKDPKFESKYGKMGQELMTEFLNNYARQGRYKSNQLLDSLRRATSRGVVGFRLPSQLVHMANIPLAMTHTGPLWWNKALNDVMTDDGQNFLKKYFAESFERGGGEPALTELEQTKAGSESLLTKATKAGFAGQRFIDRYVTQASILGAYMKELNRKGLNASDYASLPFDKDAARQARVLARRAVASPIYKDVPPALTRGGSLSKAFFQFQNTFLDQWSNIRYEFANVGIPEAFKGNPKLLAGMLFGLAGMFAVETSIKHGYQVAKKKLAGNDKEDDDAYQKELLYEMSRRVPGAGQLQSAVLYGATGIPAIDVALEIPKEGYKAFKADEPAAKALHTTRAIGAVGELAIPGASQLTDVASALEQRHFFKPHEKRLEEATGKKVSEMSFPERVKAERDYKASAEKLSPETKAKAAEKSIANITKRGEELSKEMSKADRGWMESRGLSVPGFDNKIHAGKTLVYLTKPEMERLSKYTLEAYNEAMGEVRQQYPKLDDNSKDVYFNARMSAARGKARTRIINELNSQNESNQKTKKRFTVFDTE